MLAKLGMLLFLVGVALAVIRLVSRARILVGKTGKRTRPSRPDRTQALKPCPRCGTYVPDGQCDCGQQGTS